MRILKVGSSDTRIVANITNPNLPFNKTVVVGTLDFVPSRGVLNYMTHMKNEAGKPLGALSSNDGELNIHDMSAYLRRHELWNEIRFLALLYS